MAAAIDCPSCGHSLSTVKDSRRGEEGDNYIRRRRLCDGCGYRYTTHERVVGDDEHAETRVAKASKIMRQAGEDLIRQASEIMHPHTASSILRSVSTIDDEL